VFSPCVTYMNMYQFFKPRVQCQRDRIRLVRLAQSHAQDV
jgi:hypothetical protein